MARRLEMNKEIEEVVGNSVRMVDEIAEVVMGEG